MTEAVAVGGWAAAAVAALVAVSLVRLHGDRMEAVSRACHELRGPLTAARLGLTVGSELRALPAGRVRAIDTELGRAALALEDLSDPRRRAGLTVAEAVQIRQLAGDSVEAWQAAAGAAGVRLELRWSGPEVAVVGDRLRLAQATGNLIANALEHGAGPVQVSGSVAAGVVRLVVSDHGDGLPAPIGQLRQRARRGHGARGRGLAIAGEVARMHGGSLSAARSSTGARLVIELPLAPAGV